MMKVHECQNNERFTQIDKRITKVEKNIVELQARVDKKHEEIKRMHDNINRENEELMTLIKTVTEMATIQKELNKDTAENTRQIDGLKTEVVMQQSSINSFKWTAGIIAPMISGVIVAILIAGLGL